MHLDTAANWAQIVSVVLPILGAGWGLARKIERKYVDMHYQVVRLGDKLSFIEKQFGPNGGGLRQAVNELGDKVDRIQDRQEEIGDNLAELTGKFEQHDKQAK